MYMEIFEERTRLPLKPYAHGRMVGTRAAAIPVRNQAEEVLLANREVVVDFTGIEATQSFVDELLGVLILRHGCDILQRIVLKGCSDDVRAIIEFVASDRCDQFLKAKSH